MNSTNMLDKASCREWAQKIHADPSGFTAHKFGFPRTNPQTDLGRDPGNKQLSTRELIQLRQGFENCREAIGWDHDIMVHCHWEYDLRTSIEIAQAVESIKPLWLEDPLRVEYRSPGNGSWQAPTCRSAPARISRGAKALRISSSIRDAISCIRICAIPADFSRRNGSPTWLRCLPCLCPVTIPAARCSPVHPPVGGIDP